LKIYKKIFFCSHLFFLSF